MEQQSWFEMGDVIARPYRHATWLPLRSQVAHSEGKNGHAAFREEFVGVGSVAVPLKRQASAMKLSWEDVGLRDHGVYVFDNSYKPADVFQVQDERDLGICLVLDQSFGYDRVAEWHLHQDLVFALKLVREGDVWVRPSEAHMPVARLRRKPGGEPILMEIRTEFLRDYLAARGMGLRLTSYRSRVEVVTNADHITWPNGHIELEKQKRPLRDYRFEGIVSPIHEGGHPFGEEIAVFHVANEGVDRNSDVPIIDPSSQVGSVVGRTTIYESKGDKLYRVSGELWRDEWIDPLQESPRVKGDDDDTECDFIVDSSGNRVTASALEAATAGRWLWFRPAIVEAATSTRGGGIHWYTRQTGSLGFTPGDSVHFGLNDAGLINVFAKDVAALPNWQQRHWQAHNVTPEGGVSSELTASQVMATPADTEAPESALPQAFDEIDAAFAKRFGHKLFAEHSSAEEIMRRLHRFRGSDGAGVLELAKDLARVIVDRMDVGALQKIAQPPKDKKLGSLKSLELVLSTIVDAESARSALTPIVGIYDLRLGDAHLPSSTLSDAFKLAGVDESASTIIQAESLLTTAVEALRNISAIVAGSPVPAQAPST